MKTKKKEKGRFKIGDWVSFPYGIQQAFAQVIEDRGPLGVNHRHLYRIRFPRDHSEYDSFELPDPYLEPAPPLDKATVLRYLKEGGLVAMLQSNLIGGKEGPRVWLTYGPRGEVTPTFLADRGLIGGELVPFFALQEDKVFTGKIDQVVRFLHSFGLTHTEAEEVLAAVGTAP